MRNTKAHHFWEWFERNHRLLHHLEELTRAEQQYWLQELRGHLAAYNRYLHPLLLAADKRRRLVITANGRSASFEIVDRLVKHAPQLSSWEFVALMPPVLVEYGLDKALAARGVDISDLWFALPNGFAGHPFTLDVYIKTPDPVTNHYDDLARQAVFNVLGERLYGTYIRQVDAFNYDDLPRAERRLLLPIEHLSLYATTWADSSFVARISEETTEGP